MLIKENESLSKYTTFRMGGYAEKIYFPETVEELCNLVRDNENIREYIIGGGSNLLINDKKKYDSVLCLKNFNKKIEFMGEGRYYIGASVHLQKMIKFINKDGFGGIEYLVSVPGLVGGAIYMNAGRGKKYGECISDYLLSVDILVNDNIKIIKKEDCAFSYRASVFQNMSNCIILGATFKFPNVSREDSSAKILERMNLCKRIQDMSAPNFGTVFCESNKYIMAFTKIIHPGYKNGCAYSSRTTNWMLRGENGTYDQAIRLLNKIKKWHCLFGQECRTEVRIWN